jgi:NTP pyrophosphatase (non-canonical NTP hydrolase)
MQLDEITKIVHDNAVAKGWWDDTPEFPLRSDGDCLMLMVTELAEAMEELRDGHAPHEIYFKGDKPEGVPVELADTIIRICDFAGRHGIKLDEAVALKMKYNETRPYKHGRVK